MDHWVFGTVRVFNQSWAEWPADPGRTNDLFGFMCSIMTQVSPNNVTNWSCTSCQTSTSYGPQNPFLCYTSPTLRSTMESWYISSDYSTVLIIAFWSRWWSRGQCCIETVSTEVLGQTSIFWIVRYFELSHMHLLSYKQLNIFKLLLEFNENSDPQKSIFTMHRLLPVVPDSASPGRVRNAT